MDMCQRKLFVCLHPKLYSLWLNGSSPSTLKSAAPNERPRVKPSRMSHKSCSDVLSPGLKAGIPKGSIGVALLWVVGELKNGLLLEVDVDGLLLSIVDALDKVALCDLVLGGGGFKRGN